MMLTVVHVAMVHIVVHALPEAALFVIVGSVLHTVGSQDGRTMASACHHSIIMCRSWSEVHHGHMYTCTRHICLVLCAAYYDVMTML